MHASGVGVSMCCFWHEDPLDLIKFGLIWFSSILAVASLVRTRSVRNRAVTRPSVVC